MCSLQRNYDVIRNWERFETGPLTVFPLWAVHYSRVIYFYHIKWSPLNVTIFITHVRILRNGSYDNAQTDLNLRCTHMPTYTCTLCYALSRREMYLSH